MKEFREIGYGSKDVKSMSQEAQDYILDRYGRGIRELKATNSYPTKTGDNGYTVLLGVWSFTKSKGIYCAVGLNKVWMATILNNKLI